MTYPNYKNMNRFSITAFFILVATFLPQCLQAELQVVEKKGKYGYANESGDVVVKPSFDQALPFNNGIAKVSKAGKWGLINEEGRVVAKCDFTTIGDFTNGIALVRKNDKYGYIRKDGTFAIKPEWNFIGSYNAYGWCWVAKGKTLNDAMKGLYRDDRLVVPAKNWKLGFYVATDSVDWSDGRMCSYLWCDEITHNLSMLSTSKTPYIWSEPNAYTSAIYSIDGTMVVKPVRTSLGAPHDGWALMKSATSKEYRYNFISTDGKNRKFFKKDIAKSKEADNMAPAMSPFYNGIAMVTNKDGYYYLVDSEGNSISQLYNLLKPIGHEGYVSVANGKCGLVAMNGSDIVKPFYKEVYFPVEGETVLAAQDASTELWGYVDMKGNTVIPFMYQGAFKYVGGKAYVKKNNDWGIVDKDNNPLIRFQHADMQLINSPEDIYIWTKSHSDNKWYAHNLQTDTRAFGKGFDKYLTAFDPHGLSVVCDQEKFGMVNNEGELVLPLEFDGYETVLRAHSYIKSLGKTKMSDIDSFRFLLYQNPETNKFKLTDTIDASMWDY